MYLNLPSLGSLSSERWSRIIPSGSTANGPQFSSTDEHASPVASDEIGRSRNLFEHALSTPTVANAASAKSVSSIPLSYLHDSNYVVHSTSTGIAPHFISASFLHLFGNILFSIIFIWRACSGSSTRNA